MRSYPLLAVLFLATAGASALAQVPAAPASAPATQPAETLEILTPSVDAQAHEVRLPAAFWNEHLADWIETAICGRPSDFLHETVLAITTTRQKMIDACRQAGFHDADAWVNNVADFPRVRGDLAVVLVEVTRNGKTETYLLDELIGYQSWNTPIGPFGWMFKGEPEGGAARLGADQPAATTAPLDNPQAVLSVGQQIIRDDPQAALAFRGLRHQSQSFLDTPLAYQEWVYPDMSFGRNPSVLPMDVYNSNGTVPVKMIVRKVTTVELLQTAAKYWHDPGMLPVIQSQYLRAQQIDQDKAKLWALLPKLAVKMKAAPEEQSAVTDSDEFHEAAVLTAAINAGYAALDGAWTDYAAAHADFSKLPPEEQKALTEQRDLWHRHMDLVARSAAANAQAEAAAARERTLEKQPASAQTAAALQKARADELDARASGMLLDAEEPLRYWRGELAKIPANDPRDAYRREVAAQVALAEAKVRVGRTGHALAEALRAPGGAGVDAASHEYKRSLLMASVAGLQVQLLDTNFQITKLQSLEEADPELPGLLQHRTELLAQIKTAQDALATTEAMGATGAPSAAATTEPAMDK